MVSVKKKGCLKTLKVLAISILVLIALFFWAVKEAFGPSKRTLTLELEEGIELICHETYNADLADVFYDLKLEMVSPRGKKVSLGRATFHDEDWEEKVTVKKWRGVLIFHLDNGRKARVILVSPSFNKVINTEFDPQLVKKEPIWKERGFKWPSPLYFGQTSLESIENGRLVVMYHYRSEDYPPFKFWDHELTYQIKKGPLNLVIDDIKEPVLTERRD